MASVGATPRAALGSGGKFLCGGKAQLFVQTQQVKYSNYQTAKHSVQRTQLLRDQPTSKVRNYIKFKRFPSRQRLIFLLDREFFVTIKHRKPKLNKPRNQALARTIKFLYSTYFLTISLKT